MAHVLHGACKAAVINVETDDKTLSIESTRIRMQKCITWTKKSKKGHTFLSESQLYCNLPITHLLTPVKTRFAYLMHAFWCLLKNRKAIDYLYGGKPGITDALRLRKPIWQDWEVTQVVVTTLKSLVGSVTVNQA